MTVKGKTRSVEKLKSGTFRVSVRYSRIFEPAVGLGKTEKAAWRNLARDLAYEYRELEKEWGKQDRALDKVREAVRE